MLGITDSLATAMLSQKNQRLPAHARCQHAAGAPSALSKSLLISLKRFTSEVKQFLPQQNQYGQRLELSLTHRGEKTRLY